MSFFSEKRLSEPLPTPELIALTLRLLSRRKELDTLKHQLDEVKNRSISEYEFYFIDPMTHYTDDPQMIGKPQRLEYFEFAKWLTGEEAARFSKIVDQMMKNSGLVSQIAAAEKMQDLECDLAAIEIKFLIAAAALNPYLQPEHIHQMPRNARQELIRLFLIYLERYLKK